VLVGRHGGLRIGVGVRIWRTRWRRNCIEVYGRLLECAGAMLGILIGVYMGLDLGVRRDCVEFRMRRMDENHGAGVYIPKGFGGLALWMEHFCAS